MMIIHYLQEMWKMTKTWDIMGEKKKHDNDSQDARGLQQMSLNMKWVSLKSLTFLDSVIILFYFSDDVA